MFYTVYKITNLVNNKIYIGVHKTNELGDNYMGSGKILKYAIKKYGIENFKREYLAIFDNPEEMFNMESELVDEEFITDSMTYNLKIGGHGGFEFINQNGLNVFGGNDGSTLRKKLENEDFRIYFSKIQSDRMKLRHQNGEINYNTFSGKNHSEETKKKIGEANSKRQKGSGNSMYGMMWIHNLELKESKRIPKGEEIPDGWLKGRKMKF